MDLEEKYDDLYNLVLNLKMAVEETKILDYKEPLQDMLCRAEEELKELEEEKEARETEEARKEEYQRQCEYRNMQGF